MTEKITIEIEVRVFEKNRNWICRSEEYGITSRGRTKENAMAKFNNIVKSILKNK